MDDCVLRPTEGVKDEQTQPDDMPWLDRKQSKKRIRAFFATIGRGMSAPTRLMRSLDDIRSKAWSALWFAVLIQCVVSLLGWGVALFMIGLLMSGGGSMLYLGGYVLFTGIALLVWLILLLIWIVIAHILVILTGSRRGWFGHTVEAISYSSSPNIIAAFPCIGIYLIPVALVWWSVSAVLALRERQQISGWRASLAVLPFPVLITASVVGLSVWGVSASISASKSYSSMMQPSKQLNAVYSSLQDYLYQQQTKTYPQHAAELFRSDLVDSTFVVNYLNHHSVDPASIPVGSGTLADIIAAGTDSDVIDQYIQEAIDDLPDNTIAYRLGEIVFTWNGLDPNDTNNPNLWLAMIDSTSNTPVKADLLAGNPAWQPHNIVYILQANGMVLPMPTSIFSRQLEIQNKLRATLNLPPLPDPTTVTYDSPAPAPPTPVKPNDH